MVYLYCCPLYKYFLLREALHVRLRLNNWPASSSPEKQYLLADISLKYKPFQKEETGDGFRFSKCWMKYFRSPQLSNYHNPIRYIWNTVEDMLLSLYFSKQLCLFLTPKLSIAYTTVWAITNSRLPPPPNCTALCYLLSAHSKDHWSQ